MPPAHHLFVATRGRAVDRGEIRGRQLVEQLGRELRAARIDRGLSLQEVGRAAGSSAPTLSRIERGLARSVSVVMLARGLAVVGLELSARAFPGGQPLRDGAHVALLAGFRAKVHRSLRWASEVPLPLPGDPRAIDAVVSGPGWAYAVEAETGPADAQALLRRLELKRRDAGLDGVILVLRRGRRTAAFLRAAGAVLVPNFPVAGRRALELLGAGVDPGGSAIVVL